MKEKNIYSVGKSLMISILLSVLFPFAGYGQVNTPSGYIVGIEDDKVYVDYTLENIKQGDILSVYTEKGYFTHPVTKKKILKEPELVAKLEIVKCYSDYSVAKAIPSQSINNLTVGMAVQPAVSVTGEEAEIKALPGDGRSSVVVAPAIINDVVGFRSFGSYVADVLMEQLISSPKIRLLDRSVLNAQIDETEFTGEYIDPGMAIQRGKIAGAQYIIQITMQKPDIVNNGTTIPWANIMSAAQSISGTNLGAQYMSNTSISKLSASVDISTRVVDLQTGEVLFMSSAKGHAEGKSQLSLEYGALGGMELNGGAEGFKQTVTGKAIQKAFLQIGRNLNKYFNGETDKKVLGTTSGYSGQDLQAKGTRLYMGTDKLSNEDVKTLFYDQPNLYFNVYRKGKKLNGWGNALIIGCPVSFIGVVGLSVAYQEYHETYDDITPIILGSAAALATVAGGIHLKTKGKRLVKNAAQLYNATQQQAYYDDSPQLNFSVTNNGIGIVLTF